jgi:tellurite resistance protein TerC
LAVPARYRHRVSFWGVFGVVVLRALVIGPGAVLLEGFARVLQLFALFPVLTGVKMPTTSAEEAEEEAEAAGRWRVRFTERRPPLAHTPCGERSFVRLTDPPSRRGSLYATPPFLALVKIEVAD